MLLERDPYENELLDIHSQIKANTLSLEDLNKRIVNSKEYKRIHDPSEYEHNLASTNASNNIQEYNEVMNALREVMPNNDDDIYDAMYLEYMIFKYKQFKNDKQKLITYIKNTPEYKDYNHNLPEKKTIVDDIKDVPNNLKESVLTVKDSLFEYNFSRPNLNNKTMSSFVKHITNDEQDEDEDDENMYTCDFYKNYIHSKTLSDKQKERNFEELQYACQISQDYSNLNSNLTLLKNQKWNVPQKRAPVCTSQECTVHDSTDQTSLIGTLIDKSTNSIMPEFNYEEQL